MKEYKIALKNEHLRLDELLHLNRCKRIALIKFAAENIPFYKEYYRNITFKSQYFDSPSFWEDIPILEKHHIKSHFNEFFNPKLESKHVRKVTTGGSTGEPLKLARDKRFPEEVLQWRMLKHWKISPAEDKLMFWRQVPTDQKCYKRVVNQAIWWPTTRIKADASSLDATKLNEIYKIAEKKHPGIFWGYVGAIEQFAIFMDQENLRFSKPPKCIWVTAAPTTTFQKNLFQKVFDSPVLDQYACSEIHWVASGVPASDNLILDYDYRHMEIVNRDGSSIHSANQQGDIILTDLHNYAFPLIRYRVGDRTAFAEDHLSQAPFFPMIHPVKGRISDFIKTSSGIILTGEYLTTIFDDYTDLIRQFQISQEDISTINIFIVPKQGAVLTNVKKTVRDILKTKTKGQLDIIFHEVESIGHDRGKIRFIINKLKS